MKTATYLLPLAAGIGAFVPLSSCAEESWVDKLSFKGDFRPRYEVIDQEGSEERKRTRFRIRFGLTAEVNDNVDIIFELASGGDNPVSTNQSFDGGFSRKDIAINLVYADWQATDDMNVHVGKVKNPVYRVGGHHLVWDSDLNPEGLAVNYSAGGFFGSIGVFSVEERSDSNDSLLYTFQAGFDFDLSENNSLKAGIGYYDYTETEGNTPFWIGLPFGNSVDAQGNFLYDYNEVQGFVEFATKIGKLPLTVFADFVQNTEAPVNDTGIAFGARIGKAGVPGTWQASLAYQDLEADAVLALYTDSDFGGGGTDATGFTLKAKYALADNWALGGTLFINEINDNIGIPMDYNRLQLDLEFKF